MRFLLEHPEQASSWASLKEFWASAKEFLYGVLRRWYWWIFALLLDPFELWNRLISPWLPTERLQDIELPSEFGRAALIVVLFWAAFLTFHELNAKYRAQTIGEATRKQKIAKLIERTLEQRQKTVEPSSGPKGQQEYISQRDAFFKSLQDVFDPDNDPLMHQKVKSMAQAAMQLGNKEGVGCVGQNIKTCDHLLASINTLR